MVWDYYAHWYVPKYGKFLKSAEWYFGNPINKILDLACGTGLLTRQLANQAALVVGLDLSEHMLKEARIRTKENNVRYVQGDFRRFFLEDTFDAVISGSDSLNYLEAPHELADVFLSVYRHLRPGGLFFFDVLDHRMCRFLAKKKVVANVCGKKFSIHYFYDTATRISESRFVWGDVIERHKRVSIEEEDVKNGAKGANLEVLERFPRPLFPWSLVRYFYLLRRPKG